MPAAAWTARTILAARRAKGSRAYSALSAPLLGRLEGACTRVSVNPTILERHGDDESHHAAIPPQAVAFATSTEEVAAIVRLCAEARVPVIPFGTGTSLEGHIQAIHGGVCLDLSEMNQVVEANEEDFDALVQAGVTRNALNAELRHTGLYFPIDPGADASIGGMAACGASGTAAVKYGTMRENVLGTTSVLASGEVMRTGGRARKSSAGYDMTRLLVGSEGTLAVLTEVRVRLHPIPSACSAAVCTFDTLDGAANAVTSILACGIPVARCELLDATAIEAFNAYPKEVADLEPVPTLFLEFTGISDASVSEQAELAAECCGAHGGGEFKWATSEAERRHLWAARHSTYYASLALRPGSKGIVTDACVPISRLAEVMRATARDIADFDVCGPLFGHAGDGNFHVILGVKEDDPPEYVAAVKAVNERLVRRALAVGGTCTGEHGIGVGKLGYLEAEHGAEGVAAMRAVKRALDPHNLLNPGKVVDLGPPIAG